LSPLTWEVLAELPVDVLDTPPLLGLVRVNLGQHTQRLTSALLGLGHRRIPLTYRNLDLRGQSTARRSRSSVESTGVVDEKATT
jgi:hypothetical protein